MTEFDLVESATEVALMLICAGLGTAIGAVYRPLEVMVPQALPVQPTPEILHVTLVLAEPVTDAVNCCCLPTTTCAEVGEIFTATDGTIVAIAVLSLLGSATDVAVTLTWAGLGTVVGAVYKPLELIVPQAFPVQPAPDTSQVTLVSVEPVTVAVNCCCLPATTCVEAGETFTTTGGSRVTAADEDLETSASEVAVTVTDAGEGRTDGALYRPVPLTTPQALPVQPAPDTFQDTDVSDEPVTVAVNCCGFPATTCAVFGETVTTTGGTMVAVAVLDLVGSANDVAVMLTCAGEGIAFGAVYSPDEERLPQALPEHPAPPRLQATLVFVVPVT